MYMSFTANRQLLNPKFEGYKLSHLPDHSVKRYGLTYLPSQAATSGRSRIPLSFEEVQSRITHNHLAVQAENYIALYVDEQLRIIAIYINPNSLDPLIQVLLELPRPISNTELNIDVHKDYPSILNVQGDFWLVSDGFGQLYALEIKAGNAMITGSYSLPTDSDIGNPFKIQNARMASEDTVTCLLSYSLRQIDPSLSRDKRTIFKVVLATLPLRGDQDHLQDLNVIWRGEGDEAPVYSFHDLYRNSFCLLGSSVYKNIEATLCPCQPPEDEAAPVPRANENISDKLLRPPPYSWTQTSDAVTVAFPVPSYIQKAAFKITLTATTLTLHINSEMQHPIPLPRYSLKPLWDGISPSSSFWTWDKEGEQQYGLLTIHLEKQHEGTRWSQVFARSSTFSDPSDVEVPEKLDPSELWLIRESLEKYTSALNNGEDASGLGLGKGVPSLAEGELDDEIDASVGREVRFTLINDAGASQSDNISSENTPISLLSTPLPGIKENSSLVIKHNIDGLFFTPKIGENASLPPNWVHTATFSALAFVLASKRDIRFTFHISSGAVFAFESGINVGGGNVYIYRTIEGKKLWAQQSVLKIASDGTGALLGVGAVGTGNNYTILCLCERELVIIHNAI